MGKAQSTASRGLHVIAMAYGYGSANSSSTPSGGLRSSPPAPGMTVVGVEKENLVFDKYTIYSYIVLLRTLPFFRADTECKHIPGLKSDFPYDLLYLCMPTRTYLPMNVQDAVAATFQKYIDLSTYIFDQRETGKWHGRKRNETQLLARVTDRRRDQCS